MSLIYQALKQSEQRVSVAPVIALRAFPAVRTNDARRHSVSKGKKLSLAMAIAALGLIAAYSLQGGLRGNTSWFTAKADPVVSAAAAQAPAPAPETPNNEPSDVATPAQRALFAERPSTLPSVTLPRALQPLPTMPPHLRMVDRLSPAPKAATPSTLRLSPTVSPNQSSKGAAGSAAHVNTEVQAPAPASAPTVAPSASAAPEASAQESQAAASEDVGALFQKMNEALAVHDKAEAQQQLRSIQARLHEGSIARLRAEAWFAHETGNLPLASRTYRLLLEKLPGDELSAINLMAIERQQNRPNEARDIVKRALRYNSNSTALRSASDQLSIGGVTQ